MSDNILVLVPADPTVASTEVHAIRNRLRDCGFLGPTSSMFGVAHELPGARFCELLLFSPAPSPGKLFAPHTVELSPPTEEIEFLGGAETESPFCPSCSFVIEEWPDLLSGWYEEKNTYVWCCPSCATQSRPWQLQWGISAGFGKQQIKVWHVGYQQAVPSPELLSHLYELGGGPWLHFFYHL